MPTRRLEILKLLREETRCRDWTIHDVQKVMKNFDCCRYAVAGGGNVVFLNASVLVAGLVTDPFVKLFALTYNPPELIMKLRSDPPHATVLSRANTKTLLMHCEKQHDALDVLRTILSITNTLEFDEGDDGKDWRVLIDCVFTSESAREKALAILSDVGLRVV